MKFGAVLPGGTATQQLEQAILAEESGWDGVFVWEAAYGVDAWTLLAAMAARTTRVKLGTMLTPLPWRRPWKVASQVATLDQLSAGRAILTVGLGAITTDLPLTGEVIDLPMRAEYLDEGIDLIRCSGRAGRNITGATTTTSATAAISRRSGVPCRSASRSGWSACGRGRNRCGASFAATGSSPNRGRRP